jgi:CheY-like chemotaxis protein
MESDQKATDWPSGENAGSIAASAPVSARGSPSRSEMLELVVSQLGHVTKVAHDAATAITTATQFAPDVVLLDIGLPVINGYTVARTLRELPEFTNVHIAAVTGWGQEADRRKAREAGFDSHFTKPLSPAVLQDLLATIAHRMWSGGDAVSTPRTRLTDWRDRDSVVAKKCYPTLPWKRRALPCCRSSPANTSRFQISSGSFDGADRRRRRSVT